MNIDLLRSTLIENFKERIDLLYDNEFNNISITLPFFLDTGDSISIYINRKENLYEFSNLMYKEISIALNKPNLLKDHLLKKDKHKEIKEKILTKNNINIDQFLTKIIKTSDINELSNEIFIYSHFICTYYNHIYNYMVTYMKSTHKKNIFQQSVKRFIEIYNSKNNYNAIEPLNNDFISNSEYYLTKNRQIITTTNNKVNLTETIIDFQNLNENTTKYKKAFVLIKSNEVSDEYLKKLEKTTEKLKINFVSIKDINNIDSEEFKNFEEDVLNDKWKL